MNKFEVENHEPSYLPEGKWKLIWADEFDGTELDRTRWDFRISFWGEEEFAAYTDKGIVLDGNSHIELHRVEKDGRYVSPQLQTGYLSFDHMDMNKLADAKNKDWSVLWPFKEFKEPKFIHRYGYYECRCKFQKDPERMWSAFWVQSPTTGARFEPEWCGIESDIMECFHVGKATTGNIYNGYSDWGKNDGRVEYELEETEDGWHYFGMDWRPDGYVFYCDGKEVSRCNDHVSHIPQFILLTTEVKGYRMKADRDGEKPMFMVDGDYVDDAFIVDFVRVYDRVE